MSGLHQRECGLLSESGVKPGLSSFTETNWLYTALSLLRVLFLKQVSRYLVSGIKVTLIMSRMTPRSGRRLRS